MGESGGSKKLWFFEGCSTLTGGCVQFSLPRCRGKHRQVPTKRRYSGRFSSFAGLLPACTDEYGKFGPVSSTNMQKVQVKFWDGKVWIGTIMVVVVAVGFVRAR